MGFEFYAGPDADPDKYRLVRLEGRGGEAALWRAEVDLVGVSETVAARCVTPVLRSTSSGSAGVGPSGRSSSGSSPIPEW